MQIEFEIDQQRLTRTSDAYLIEGSKNFVECIFSFSSDWAELDKWALFKRDNNTYEIYIEDNKCLVPIQCTSAEGEFTISVVGRKNAENVTGTASDKLLTVRGSEFVGGMGEEGRLTETYLVEVLGEVKDLREKAATSEANAAESAQNAKGYADKAKEYSESVNVYIPSVSQDGVMTWTNKAGLANPTPVNVKGERGEKGEQGAKGDTGATGAKGERGEQGPQGLQGPKGNDGAAGAAGAAATIKVGVVTTGAAGTAAKVTNSGTTSAAVLDFVIPQGPKGDKGEQGAGSIVAVDSELSSTSTNPVQNKVVKAAIDTVKKNMSQGFQTVTDSIPTKVSALENDAEYLKKGANIWVERYYTYVKSGTSDAPQVHVAQYTTSTGSFVIDLGYFTSNLTGGQSLVFTAYIQSTSDTAGTLTINNAGTIKYIGAASDLAITKAGLLLTVLMTKDWNDVVTSIVQASKLS